MEKEKRMVNKDFYPTPAALLDAVTAGVRWEALGTVLEPEAGMGDIVEYVMKRYRMRTDCELDVDCVELDPALQKILRQKGYRLVHDDFLTYQTHKQYDLIIMNPPFSNGAAHLTKALQMQEDGGNIICILNAETIRNPWTNERKALVTRLGQLNAQISYMEGGFVHADRPTDVEIAVVKVSVPKKERKSFFYEELKKKNYEEARTEANTSIAPGGFVEAIIARYNLEVESGIRLIHEYEALQPYIMSDVREDRYSVPLLELKTPGEGPMTVNQYVRLVREKYWNAILKDKRFVGNMTSNLLTDYQNQVKKLTDYDFSAFNILAVQEQMSRGLIRGIEECIIAMFDELSYQYAYSDELGSNIHYYNGWCSNKAWYINKKVVIPFMDGFSRYDGGFQVKYDALEKLMDIEKALNYLDGGLTTGEDLEMRIREAEKERQPKNIRTKYFDVTFYKKGTCHIVFTNEELLKKLNIFGAQQRRWLPPGYGKKRYEDFTPEVKAVVDEFEGEKGYKRTLTRAGYLIYDPKASLPQLELMESA